MTQSDFIKNNLKNVRAILNAKEELTLDQCRTLSACFAILAMGDPEDNILFDKTLNKGSFGVMLPY
jgi:hypothetical protein